jgi:hypothetical protein
LKPKQSAVLGKPQPWLLQLEEKFATLMRAGDIMLAIQLLRSASEQHEVPETELGQLLIQIGAQRSHLNPFLIEELPRNDPPN